MKGERPRFNIQVSETRNGRRNTFTFNRQPLRPGSVEDALYDAIVDQYKHLLHGGRFIVGGLSVDGVTFMWVTENKRGVVVKVTPVA